MMTLDEVMNELAAKATPATKATYLRHGAVEPVFGVKVGDLKPLQKQLKGQQELALALYATKNSDAMYLAGLIADGAPMSPQQLKQWAKAATWHMIAGCTVPWVTADHPQAVVLATKWISAKHELIATAGWSTLAAVAATWPDENLPSDDLRQFLDLVPDGLATAPNRAKYAMNSFVISVGTYVAPLAQHALAIAQTIGTVEVDMGPTECKVPHAAQYIEKSRKGAPVAPKRKTVRC